MSSLIWCHLITLREQNLFTLGPLRHFLGWFVVFLLLDWQTRLVRPIPGFSLQPWRFMSFPGEFMGSETQIISSTVCVYIYIYIKLSYHYKIAVMVQQKLEWCMMGAFESCQKTSGNENCKYIAPKSHILFRMLYLRTTKKYVGYISKIQPTQCERQFFFKPNPVDFTPHGTNCDFSSSLKFHMTASRPWMRSSAICLLSSQSVTFGITALRLLFVETRVTPLHTRWVGEIKWHLSSKGLHHRRQPLV